MRPRDLGEGVATYLVSNNCHNTQPLLATEEIKEKFRELLWKAADFSCVKVRSYVIMNNCIKFVVTIPKRESLTWQIIAQKVGNLYGEVKQVELEARWGLYECKSSDVSLPVETRDENARLLAEETQRYTKRMFNLSQFVKVLKECFDTEFKKLIFFTGTIWNGRYRSVVLAENGEVPYDDAPPVEMMPVRMGVAKSPAAYKWCTLGRASKEERSSIIEFARAHLGKDIPEEEALAHYKMNVYKHGLEVRDSNNKVVLRGVTMQMYSNAISNYERYRRSSPGDQ